MKRLLLLSGAALLLIAAPALAQAPPGVLDGLMQSFAAAVNNTWSTPLRQYGLSLWGYLAALQLAWSLLAYMLASSDVRNQMAGRMLIQVMLICAAFLLINQLPIWIGGLVFDSFAQIGENVAGDFMSPTLVVSYGSEFSAILMGGLSQVGLLDAMAIVFWVALVSILVYISFLLIAAQLVITYMEVYTVLGLGGFVMAFGANQWTARLSENYLAYALHVGIKMLLLTLIVALGGPLIFEWGQRIQDGANWSTDIKPILDVVGGVFCFAFAALYIPNRVASRLTAGMDFGWTAAMRG